MAKSKQTPQTNVNSNLWAEALRTYTEDKGAEDRARGTTKRHQIAFESQGITATTIRGRFKEANMTADERTALYAEEQVSRRALDLWSADSPEDFNRLMERAAKTEPATPEELGKLAGVRAYGDGFNGGAHGGLTADDNQHVPGSIEHQQWGRGVLDGIDYEATFGGGTTTRQASAMREAEEGVQSDRTEAPKKARGRPRKQEAAVGPEPDADLEQAVAAQLGEAPVEVPAEGLFSDMPTPPGLPN